MNHLQLYLALLHLHLRLYSKVGPRLINSLDLFKHLLLFMLGIYEFVL